MSRASAAPESAETMAIREKSAHDTYLKMRELLGHVVPDVELQLKAELVHEIQELKAEKNAIILGHNYMEPALYHTVPDFTGDSLELARRAAEAQADIIVFCGVRFMAETAKILNPKRTVLLPAKKAGCSLAEAITPADVRALRERYPGVPVVTYVNTYADVKAECDVCCTSSNASWVVESLGTDSVIMIPDEFLAGNVARETGKTIIFPTREGDVVKDPDVKPEIIGWRGRCEVHDLFTVADVDQVRAQFPDVTVLAHPECRPEVVEAADYSGSTSQMVRFVEESDKARYLLLTECAMGDNIAAENPDKDMLRLCSHRCPHMAEITLEETRDALLHGQQVIEVPEDIRVRAKRAVDRMLEIGRPPGERMRSAS